MQILLLKCCGRRCASSVGCTSVHNNILFWLQQCFFCTFLCVNNAISGCTRLIKQSCFLGCSCASSACFQCAMTGWTTHQANSSFLAAPVLLLRIFMRNQCNDCAGMSFDMYTSVYMHYVYMNLGTVRELQIAGKPGTEHPKARGKSREN